MAFRSEFEFTLPLGFVDSKGEVHRRGTMRLSTARDEIVPLQDARVRKNRSYLIIIVLARVITKLEGLEMIDTGVIEGLYSEDLRYLQNFYQQINRTGRTLMRVDCPHCEQEFDVDIGGADPPGES